MYPSAYWKRNTDVMNWLFATLIFFSIETPTGLRLHNFFHLFVALWAATQMKFNFRRNVSIAIGAALLIFFFSLIRSHDSSYALLSFNMLFYIYGVLIGQKLDEKGVWPYILVGISSIVADTIWRVLNPDFTIHEAFDEHPIFYAYKENSIIGLDSNFVAINAICVIALCLASKPPATLRVLAYLCLPMTLSRSAILSVFVARTLQYRVFWLLAPIALYFAYRFFSTDSSFLSKLAIIENYLAMLESEDFSVLFGEGFGPVSAYGRWHSAGHTHFYDITFWHGLLGGSLIALLFGVMIFGSKTRNVTEAYNFFWISLIIAGFSYLPVFSHVVWFTLGLIATKKEKAKS